MTDHGIATYPCGEHEGYKLHVDEFGEFSADVDGTLLTASTIKALRRAIETELRNSLEAPHLRGVRVVVRVGRVVAGDVFVGGELTGKRRAASGNRRRVEYEVRRDDGRRMWEWFQRSSIYDPATVPLAKLEKLDARIARLQKQRAEILQGATFLDVRTGRSAKSAGG